MEKNKEKNFVSAVVYVNNNQRQITEFLRTVNAALSGNFEKYEIICVNDASTDGSAQKIKAAAGEIGDSVLSVINMSYYQGEEAAMNAGADLAIGDFVFEFDSVRLDYDPALIMEVYSKALLGYDIVSASPDSKKRLSSKVFYYFFNRYANTQYALSTETFRVLSRRAINRVQSISKTIPYRKALYANCGLKMFRMTYNSVKNAEKNKSHEPTRRELAFSSLILFTDIGYTIAKILTFIMMLTTLACGVYAVYIYLSSSPVAGWTTTMLILSAGFFGTFAVLTIIIKYLSILLKLVFLKQKYVVENIEKM